MATEVMLVPIAADEPTWESYLEEFHDERPGITEDVLARCRAEGRTPYQWCAEPLLGIAGPVVDLACGSGPVAGLLPGWVGVDRSSGELRAAQARGRGPLLHASATALPFPTKTIGGAVCSMALQIVDAPGAALSELARIVRPGGRVVLLVPTSGPVPWRHALRYLALQLALRRRIRYPNDAALTPERLRGMAERAGLQVTSDDRAGFALPIDDRADASLLLRSLYLPGVSDRHLEEGRLVIERAAGTALTIPLRRIVLERTQPGPTAGPDQEVRP
jgi:SAM-dependent methyltransferase